ncbi:MAG: VWA domain-containing protein [Deltaproteobacteria bacterium]|nr:VWA domain-containing protein [Deltaproteobacteria bacterium]
MTLMQVLASGVVRPDLTEFYHVARSLLVKSENLYDTWDQVFGAIFGDGQMPTRVAEELLAWLAHPLPLPELSPEELAAWGRLSLDELRRLFEQRLREQSERHDGGSRWIGTGGTSPFGHGGVHPGGLRVGGQGRNRSAAQIAAERRFHAYRDDRILDTRALTVALKKLRRLGRVGEPELDVEESIDRTCRNGGELTLELRPPRTNEARILLLMDVGGSMDPYIQLVERLFSAARGLHHWRNFEAFSFHNCVYEKLYPKVYGRDGVATADILQGRSERSFLVMVGDASMAPGELVERYGAIDYYHRNGTPGIVWLHRLRTRFPRAVWLNPMPEAWWGGWTTRIIAELFPMFPLTLGGLEDAVDNLVRGRPDAVPDLDSLEKWYSRRDSNARPTV